MKWRTSGDWIAGANSPSPARSAEPTRRGIQPNVVPDVATIWFYFRERDYESIKALHEKGRKSSRRAPRS